MMDKKLEDGIRAKIWENELQEGQLAITEWGTQVTMTKDGALQLKKMLEDFFGSNAQEDDCEKSSEGLNCLLCGEEIESCYFCDSCDQKVEKKFRKVIDNILNKEEDRWTKK